MIFYIAAYAFVALATAIAIFDHDNYRVRFELFSSAAIGAMWPMLFAVRIITKLILR